MSTLKTDIEKALAARGADPASDRMARARPLLDFIAKGEGGYESMNNGTNAAKKIVDSTHDAKSLLGKPLSEMTFGEIKSMQAGTRQTGRKLFAFGRYQIVPETLPIAMSAAGLTDNDYATPENQDKLGFGLLTGSKRPALRDYLLGKSDDVDAAMFDFAKEWASIPVPKEFTTPKGVKLQPGDSYYKGTGNRASHKVDDVRAALVAARQAPEAPKAPPGKPEQPSPQPVAMAGFKPPPLPEIDLEPAKQAFSDFLGGAARIGSDVARAAGETELPSFGPSKLSPPTLPEIDLEPAKQAFSDFRDGAARLGSNVTKAADETELPAFGPSSLTPPSLPEIDLEPAKQAFSDFLGGAARLGSNVTKAAGETELPAFGPSSLTPPSLPSIEMPNLDPVQQAFASFLGDAEPTAPAVAAPAVAAPAVAAPAVEPPKVRLRKKEPRDPPARYEGAQLAALDMYTDRSWIDEASTAAALESDITRFESAPTDFVDAFNRGAGSGIVQMGADFDYARAAFAGAFGDQDALQYYLGRAKDAEDRAAEIMGATQSLEQLFEDPTFEGFFNKAAGTVGQVAPSLAATIAAAFATGGTAAIGSTSVQLGSKQLTVAAAKKLVKDTALKKVRGEVLDLDEEKLLKGAYLAIRRGRADAFKKGAVVGAIGVEYPQMTGASFREFQDAGVDLNDPNYGLAAIGIGGGLAAIGVYGEKLIAEGALGMLTKQGERLPYGKNVLTRITDDLIKLSGKGALVEGTTETLQEAGLIAQRKAVDPGYSDEEARWRLAESAFAGAVAGGAMGGAGGVVTGTVSSINMEPPVSTERLRAEATRLRTTALNGKFGPQMRPGYRSEYEAAKGAPPQYAEDYKGLIHPAVQAQMAKSDYTPEAKAEFESAIDKMQEAYGHMDAGRPDLARAALDEARKIIDASKASLTYEYGQVKYQLRQSYASLNQKSKMESGADTAQRIMDRAKEMLKTARDKTQQGEEVAGDTQVTVAGPTPEPQADYEAQLAHLGRTNSPKRGVWIPENAGVEVDDDFEPNVPRQTGNVWAVSIPGQGTLITRTEEDAAALATAEDFEAELARILGYSAPKPVDADRVVRVLNEQGAVIFEEATNEAGVAAAEARAAEIAATEPGATVDTVDSVEALRQRAGRVEQESSRPVSSQPETPAVESDLPEQEGPPIVRNMTDDGVPAYIAESEVAIAAIKQARDSVRKLLTSLNFKFTDSPDLSLSELERIASKYLTGLHNDDPAFLDDAAKALSYALYTDINEGVDINIPRPVIEKALRSWLEDGKAPKIDRTIWTTIVQALNRLLAVFSGKEFATIERALENTIDGILTGRDFSFKPRQGYEKLSFQKEMDNNPLAVQVLTSLLKSGIPFTLTGSVAYADQVPVYRKANSPLHDVDLVLHPKDVDKALKWFSEEDPENWGDVKMMYMFFPGGMKTVGIAAVPAGYEIRNLSSFWNVKENNPQRSYDVYNKETGEKVGSYFFLRGSKETFEGLAGVTIDLIGDDRQTKVPQSFTHNGEILNLNVSSYVGGFAAKLAMLRPKDVADFKAVVPPARPAPAVRNMEQEGPPVVRNMTDDAPADGTVSFPLPARRALNNLPARWKDAKALLPVQWRKALTAAGLSKVDIELVVDPLLADLTGGDNAKRVSKIDLEARMRLAEPRGRVIDSEESKFGQFVDGQWFFSTDSLAEYLKVFEFTLEERKKYATDSQTIALAEKLLPRIKAAVQDYPKSTIGAFFSTLTEKDYAAYSVSGKLASKYRTGASSGYRQFVVIDNASDYSEHNWDNAGVMAHYRYEVSTGAVTVVELQSTALQNYDPEKGVSTDKIENARVSLVRAENEHKSFMDAYSAALNTYTMIMNAVVDDVSGYDAARAEALKTPGATEFYALEQGAFEAGSTFVGALINADVARVNAAVKTAAKTLDELDPFGANPRDIVSSIYDNGADAVEEHLTSITGKRKAFRDTLYMLAQDRALKEKEPRLHSALLGLIDYTQRYDAAQRTMLNALGFDHVYSLQQKLADRNYLEEKVRIARQKLQLELDGAKAPAPATNLTLWSVWERNGIFHALNLALDGGQDRIVFTNGAALHPDIRYPRRYDTEDAKVGYNRGLVNYYDNVLPSIIKKVAQSIGARVEFDRQDPKELHQDMGTTRERWPQSPGYYSIVLTPEAKQALLDRRAQFEDGGKTYTRFMEDDAEPDTQGPNPLRVTENEGEPGIKIAEYLPQADGRTTPEPEFNARLDAALEQMDPEAAGTFEQFRGDISDAFLKRIETIAQDGEFYYAVQEPAADGKDRIVLYRRAKGLTRGEGQLEEDMEDNRASLIRYVKRDARSTSNNQEAATPGTGGATSIVAIAPDGKRTRPNIRQLIGMGSKMNREDTRAMVSGSTVPQGDNMTRVEAARAGLLRAISELIEQGYSFEIDVAPTELAGDNILLKDAQRYYSVMNADGSILLEAKSLDEAYKTYANAPDGATFGYYLMDPTTGTTGNKRFVIKPGEVYSWYTQVTRAKQGNVRRSGTRPLQLNKRDLAPVPGENAYGYPPLRDQNVYKNMTYGDLMDAKAPQVTAPDAAANVEADQLAAFMKRNPEATPDDIKVFKKELRDRQLQSDPADIEGVQDTPETDMLKNQIQAYVKENPQDAAPFENAGRSRQREQDAFTNMRDDSPQPGTVTGQLADPDAELTRLDNLLNKLSEDARNNLRKYKRFLRRTDIITLEIAEREGVLGAIEIFPVRNNTGKIDARATAPVRDGFIRLYTPRVTGPNAVASQGTGRLYTSSLATAQRVAGEAGLDFVDVARDAAEQYAMDDTSFVLHSSLDSQRKPFQPAQGRYKSTVIGLRIRMGRLPDGEGLNPKRNEQLLQLASIVFRDDAGSIRTITRNLSRITPARLNRWISHRMQDDTVRIVVGRAGIVMGNSQVSFPGFQPPPIDAHRMIIEFVKDPTAVELQNTVGRADRKTEADIIRLQNKVDELQRAIEPLRKIMAQAQAQATIKETERKLGPLLEQLRKANAELATARRFAREQVGTGVSLRPKEQTKRPATLRVHSDLPAAVRRTLGIVHRIVNPAIPVDIFKLSDLTDEKIDAMGMAADVAAELKKQVARMRAKSGLQGALISRGRHLIILNDSVYVDARSDARMALTLSHEYGHILFLEQFGSLEDGTHPNEPAIMEMYKSYVAERSAAGKKVETLEEWFSDQVAAYVYREVAGLKQARTKKGEAVSIEKEVKDPEVVRLFKFIADTLKKVFNAVNAAFGGRFDQTLGFTEWFEAVAEARRADPQSHVVLGFTIRNMAQQTVHGAPHQQLGAKIMDDANGLLKDFMKEPINTMKRTFYATDDYLRSLGPAGVELAKFFHGRAQSGEGMGFHSAKIAEQHRWFTRLADAIGIDKDKMTSDEIDDILFEAEDNTIPTAQLSPKAQAVRQVFDDMYEQYLTYEETDPDGVVRKKKWFSVKKGENYSPRQMNTALIAENPQAFADALVAEGETRANADAIAAYLAMQAGSIVPQGNGPLDAPMMPHGRSRTLAHIPTKRLRSAMGGDPKYGWILPPQVAMTQYIHFTTRKVEYERRGGKDRLERLVSKVPEERRHDTVKALEANLGKLGDDIRFRPAARQFNSILQVATTLTTLTFAVFASLPDLAGVIIRSKDFSNFATAMRELKLTMTEGENRAFARAVGVVTNQSLETVFMAPGEMDYTHPWAKRIIDKFFWLNGTEAYTRFVRTFAAGMGREFIIETALADDYGPRHERYLTELGLTRDDVQSWVRDNQPMADLTPGSRDHRIANAISRFAEEAIIRPNSALKPGWASNPYFNAIWQLKSYFYAYGKIVVAGMYREFRNRVDVDGDAKGAYQQIAVAVGAILILTMLGLEAREWTKWLLRHFVPFGLAGDPDMALQTDNMSMAQYSWEIFDRSGLMGPFTLATSAMEGVEREGFLGPVIATVPGVDMVDDSVFDGDWSRVLPVVNNL